MRRMLVMAVVLIAAMTVSGEPAMAQSSSDRSIELNALFGRGGISVGDIGFKAGNAFGASFEYPMFQGEKFALNASMGFTHASTKPIATDLGNVTASQNSVGGGMIVYAWPKKKFRPYGGFDQGIVSNKFSVGGTGQSRNAYGTGLFGGFKFDIGERISLGPRAGYVFSSSYGYDQNGNVQRQGIRGTQLLVVVSWRFK
ncbi:MAG: outer membrane beta-barrel protein [Candidatus Liptonbacteria bacterium]|nr:outer membrane beta-barrel protein [Candidatus Liptonbacteria bacterium]